MERTSPGRLRMGAGLLLAVATAMSGATGVPAQESQTTLVIPKASTDLLSEGHSGGYVEAFANGERCGRLTFADTSQRNETGDHMLRLDAPGAPAACATAGATLTLVNGLGQTLATKRSLVAGSANVVQSLAPEPPGTSASPVPLPPQTGTGVSETSGDIPRNGFIVLGVLLAATGAAVRGASLRRSG